LGGREGTDFFIALLYAPPVHMIKLTTSTASRACTFDLLLSRIGDAAAHLRSLAEVMSRVVSRTFGELGAILGILSEVVRLFHSFLLCQGRRRQADVYKGAFGDTFSTLMNTRSGGLQRRVVKLGLEERRPQWLSWARS
jgi:hypothetical protein